jgi:hypothetical protein
MKYAAMIAVILLMAGCTALPASRVSGSGDSASGIICSPRWNVDANRQTWTCGDDAMANISPLVYAEVTDAY